MKVAVGFLLTGLVLLGLLLYHSIVRVDQTIDIHVMDTYFVISYGSFSLLLLLFAAHLFGLGGLIGTGFRKSFFLYFFLFVLLIDGLLAVWIWRLFL